MGKVIAVNAASGAILADLSTTVKQAQHLGGDWAVLADEVLAEALRKGLSQARALARSSKALTDARQSLTWVTRDVRLLLGETYDRLWNMLGRPAYDQALAEMFPAGAMTAVTGPDTDHPNKLMTLAKQLADVSYPRLSAPWCADQAVVVLDARKRLMAALQAVSDARSEASSDSQMLRVRARAAHIQLSLYKKALLAKRYRQDEIHRVIPDRSVPVPRRTTAPSGDLDADLDGLGDDVGAVPPGAEPGVTVEPETPVDPGFTADTEPPVEDEVSGPSPAEDELPPEPADPQPEAPATERRPLSVVPASTPRPEPAVGPAAGTRNAA